MAEQLDLFGPPGPASAARGAAAETGDAAPVVPPGGSGGSPSRRRPRTVPSSLPSGDALAAELSRCLGRPVELVLTDNRRRIASARPAGEVLAVRVHRCFTGAGGDVLGALAAVLAGDGGREDRQRVQAHFAEHGPSPRPPRRRATRLVPVGDTLDLRDVCRAVDAECFGGTVGASITWGRRPPRRPRRRRGRRRRSIRLGAYCAERHLVTVHRVLDHPEVPRWVVAWVVFHELLHAVEPPVRPEGARRRRVHTAAFRAREAQHPDTRRAAAWVERHLDRLLARAAGER